MTVRRLALAIVILVALPTTAAMGWDLDDLNRTVAFTNFIVGEGCSGTLISVPERLILTNAHCIDRYITVEQRTETLPDGRVRQVRVELRREVPVSQRQYRGYETVGRIEYTARIVAFKKARDLGLLQILAEEIPHPLAARILPESKTVTRGETVWVVGNPNGLDATVVAGVLSSTNRAFEVDWTEPGEKLPFYQFSGGIWYGNSGGSLYNDQGYLIGVPGAIAGTAHLGLAIPITEVRAFLKESCFSRVFDPQRAAEDKRCEAERVKKRERSVDSPGNDATSSGYGSGTEWSS